MRGIVINKFRGDIKLLKPGLDMIEDEVGIPVIGVVPYLEYLRLPAEDSQSLGENDQQRAEIVVLRLPKISNFTDFEPLAFDHRIKLRYVSSPGELGDPDAIIIPGTKSTIDDLKWIKNSGFDKIKTLSGKIPIIGICGGYQILGRRIYDEGVETREASEHEGLGLLEVETSFESYEKTTTPVSGMVVTDKGVFAGMKGMSVSGYEIHMGRTILLDGAEPIFKIKGEDEGAVSRDSMVFGTYIHGLFDSGPFREGFVNFILKSSNFKRSVSGKDISEVWERTIEEIGKTVNSSVDLSWFYED